MILPILSPPDRHRNQKRLSQLREKRKQNRVLKTSRQKDRLIRYRRVIRWLLPGLVVKRWMLTSGLGLLLALLGAAIWADLKPIYWMIETLIWSLGAVTTFQLKSNSGAREVF